MATIAHAALRRGLYTALASAALLLAAALAFLSIRHYGRSLQAPAAADAGLAVAAAAAHGPLYQLLLALTAVLALCALFGRICRWLGQPPVIGEVLAGVALGPSLLGVEWSALILPPEVAPQLGVVAQLGVILYMFIIGLELDGDMLRRRAHVAVTVSQASIVLPFVLGAMLALYLYPRYAAGGVSFTSFALFMGVALSITAFPVLARILSDRGLQRTDLGVLALGCAAANDVTAWCLLALTVGIVQAQPGGGLQVVAGALAFGGVMLLAVRPLLRRMVARWEADPLPRSASATIFLGLTLSAFAAEAIGIHALFGAFLLGAILPHGSQVARSFMRQLEPVVTIFLLPAFFAYTGMRTRFDLIAGSEQWIAFGVILLVAVAGKFGGTLIAARFCGLGWRESSALGVLMNTRGLVELIVLNVGLSLGVISQEVFAMMVAMAIVTTLATGPLLKLLRIG